MTPHQWRIRARPRSTGISATGPFRYWGIQCENNNANVISLQEVEFHKTLGGAQFANSGNCTVTSNKSYDPACPPQNAVDGIYVDVGANPYWHYAWESPATNIPVRLIFDFGTAQAFAELKMFPEPVTGPGVAVGSDVNRAPMQLRIQTSIDAVTWTDCVVQPYNFDLFGATTGQHPTTFAIP